MMSDRRRHCRPQRTGLEVLSFASLWLLAVAAAGAEWRIADSDYRLIYRVIGQPSQPEAGIYLRIPDAGLLPERFEVVVYSDRGERLPAFLVWHNPAEAAGVVVATPTTGRAEELRVYIRPGATEPWRERAERAPRPGPFLYTEEQRSPSLNQAIGLSRTISTFENPTGNARMGMVPNLHYEENPFGSQTQFISWFTAWIDVREPGSYYFATVSNAGSLVRVNGQQVVRVPGAMPRAQMRQGQRGGSIELGRGLHHIEYFQFFDSGRNPEMLLAWRTPSRGRDEMPQVMPRSAFLRSGETVLMDAQSKMNLAAADRTRPGAETRGTPPPVMEFRALTYLWPDHVPEAMMLFSFEAWNHRRYGDDARYRWYLGDTLVAEGPTFNWIVEGREPLEIKLEVSNAAGTSTTTRSVYFVHAPRRATPNRESDRSRYRQALVNHLQAVNGAADTVWTRNHAALIAEVVEPFRDDDGLLALLLEKRPRSFEQMTDGDRWLIEESLFVPARRESPAQARELARRFVDMNSGDKAKFRWRLEDARLELYEFNQPEQALQLLHRVQPQRPTDEQAFEVAVLRGDVYRFQGDFDRAEAIYKEAAARRPARPRSSPREIPEWREKTVRTASYFTRIREMVREGFYPEARELLRQWEWENPQQKLGGEYIVAEASLHMALNDYRRAAAIASTLRQRGVVDNFLPTALRIEAESLAALGDRAALEELRQKATELVPGHEVLEEMVTLLQRRQT